MSEQMVKGKTTFGFENPEPGVYLFEIKEVEFVDVEDKGAQCKIKLEIIDGQHPDSIGLPVFHNNNLWNPAGVIALIGFGIVATGMADKEYPLSYFNDAKIQNVLRKKAIGQQIGGVVIIKSAGKNAKNPDVKFANLWEIFTKKEYPARLKEAEKKSAGTNKSSGAKASGDKEKKDDEVKTDDTDW